jgi:hypothetical protein
MQNSLQLTSPFLPFLLNLLPNIGHLKADLGQSDPPTDLESLYPASAGSNLKLVTHTVPLLGLSPVRTEYSIRTPGLLAFSICTEDEVRQQVCACQPFTTSLLP